MNDKKWNQTKSGIFVFLPFIIDSFYEKHLENINESYNQIFNPIHENNISQGPLENNSQYSNYKIARNEDE